MTWIDPRCINEFSTKELVDELRKRDEVKSIDVTPHNLYCVSGVKEIGPATILIIIQK